MNTIKKTYDRQLSLIAFTSPFFILIILFIILIKTSLSYTYLPLAALIGIPLCYIWNMRGLAGALSLLIILSLYKYPDISSKENLLYLGLTASLAITLYTIALVFQEVTAYLNTNRQTIDTLQSNIQEHENVLKTHHDEWTIQQQALETQKINLETTLLERESTLQHHEKTVGVIRKELADLSKKHEILTTELFSKRNEVRGLHLNLEEARHEIQQLLTAQNSDTSLLDIQNLSEQLTLKEKVISELHMQLQESSEKISVTTKQLEACFQELTAEQEINFENKTHAEHVFKEQMLQQALLQETQNLLATQTREKELLEATLKTLQQESELLREQNSQHLDLVKTHETFIELQKSSLKEQNDHALHEKELLEAALKTLQQESELLREQNSQHLDLVKTHETLIEFQKNTLKEQEDRFQHEKELLEAALKTLQQESELLHEQNSQHLDLVKTHETLIEFQKNTLKEQEDRFQHEKETFNKTHSQLAENEEILLKQIRELNAQWMLVQQQLEESQRKASDHEALNESFSQTQDKLLVLTAEKESLLLQLKNVQEEQTIPSPNWTEVHHELRRYEGLYLQLRNQFIEKSTTLDETRRELFNTQEEVLRLQLEQKEASLYNRDPLDREIDRHLIHMEQEYADTCREYQQEVDALHQLIETLLK